MNPSATLASESMRDLYGRARRAAKTNLSIFITGETGTGKEVLARYIHGESGVSGHFVPIDCTAFPEHLVESELFGHEKGAFTGAIARREGLLESARSGTACFDEIGDMPLNLQAKLLRALEYGFRRIGGSECQSPEFRTIAMTNRDLLQDVREGRFREDLYYRLGVVELRIPPLRERPEDIPALIQQFWGDQRPGPAPAVVDLLTRYHWPGNVRQLKHCIRCMAQLRTCSLLDAAATASSCDIVRSIRPAQCRPRKGPALVEDWPTRQAPAQQSTLAAAEMAAITEALRRANGSPTIAARLLGVGRTTVYRKIKSYGLQFAASEKVAI
jgi:DNA-binding NtrC family response regulator